MSNFCCQNQINILRSLSYHNARRLAEVLVAFWLTQTLKLFYYSMFRIEEKSDLCCWCTLAAACCIGFTNGNSNWGIVLDGSIGYRGVI